MCKCKSKVSLCNKKTKIYQTIKGLIILFIKFQFSIKCNQAFRPLHTSTSNIYLNLSLNPNGLVTYIIPDAFVSSSMHLYYLQYASWLQTNTQQRFLYIKSSQVQAYVLVRPRATGLPTRRPLSFSSLPWHSWRWSWYPYKRKVLVASSRACIHTTTKGCLRVIYLMPWQVGDL